MSQTDIAHVDAASAAPALASRAFTLAYRIFAYFGMFSIYTVLIYGFRFDHAASPSNYLVNLGLYALFVVPHLIMTRSWFKKAVWKNPAGHPRERRFFITTTIVTWLVIILFNQPVPGPALYVAPWITFLAITFFFMGFFLFFQGVMLPQIDGLLGVPGSVTAYSHGPETPLFTEGPYAKVRHPMYRGFMLAAGCSLLINPNTSQLFWIILLGATFIAFIPVEEAQLIRARGDDYREYMKKTPWRLIPGVW